MTPTLRALGAALVAGGLLLAACTRFLSTPATVEPTTQPAAPQATQPPPTPARRPTATVAATEHPGLQATLGEVVNAVQAKVSAGSSFVAAANGAAINAGGQVQTGPDSSAQLDLAGHADLRLDAASLLRIESMGSDLAGPLSLVTLDSGRLTIATHAGTVQVLMSIGVAQLKGGLASLQFNPGDPGTVADDTLHIDCLTGPCSLRFKSSDIAIANGQSLTVKGDSTEVIKAEMTQAQIQDVLARNPVAGPTASPETLTAAPQASLAAATDTPAASEAPSATSRAAGPTPSATAAGEAATATVSATATATTEPTATATVAVTPTTGKPPTATPTGAAVTAPAGTPASGILGKHVVKYGESLFCIGRAYGVLPAAIAQASGLSGLSAAINPGDTLTIPAVQWTSIPPGPVCEKQFNSPFPPG